MAKKKLTITSALVRTTKPELVDLENLNKDVAKALKKYEGKVYDDTTPTGIEVVREDRASLRSLRVATKTTEKALKAPLLAEQRQIGRIASGIIETLQTIEDPLAAMLKKDKDRKEAAKQAKIKAERERVDAIQVLIRKMGDLPYACRNMPSSSIKKAITKLERSSLTKKVFQEYLEQATTTQEEASTALRSLLEEAETKEADKAQLAKDQEAVRKREKAVAKDEVAQEEEVGEDDPEWKPDAAYFLNCIGSECRTRKSAADKVKAIKLLLKDWDEVK